VCSRDACLTDPAEADVVWMCLPRDVPVSEVAELDISRSAHAV
jgi:hypothetical protein